MSASFSIRPLRPSDARAYRDLRLEALQGSPEAFGSSYEEEAPLPLETIEARIPTSGPNAIFGAFAGEALVGMAGFAVYERVKARHKGVMWGVFVRPEWRKQRVGKALVRQVIDHASRHVIMIEAAVGLANESARRTYHGLGFTPYGVERKAIRIGDVFHDEELLYLDLPQAQGV
ncbi:GNAT family N-acetyltransferase [Microvirga mediterraneensis]|uniref:GNAT family N-acetyltransferase n=1 Tax=Microvirga mediterraneensis TaxID=2754695 RepID=A0A838BSM6_9HYPH|nr:GNAT family N-acetyltransferase [Microvirga mediterraneensis]MBA1157893.1 GNAT family N-acetyltransferase [Microvirga mediterraneensis]